MGYELIITEKPNAAKKIAEALATGKPIKNNLKGVPYYQVTHGKKDIVVGCAVGHLYTVSEKDKKAGWTYPVFDIKWTESGDAKKESAYTKKYLSALKKLGKDATEFTVATDYDIEGEVIGLNVLRFACKQKDANRMKFSTLTKDDLIKAYESKSKTLDWGQAYAGETRHFLDWMYGINLSRALTLSIKNATKRHKILSSGRVQGPALKIVVDKEKEIMAFVPVPYWELQLTGSINGGAILAQHKENPFKEEQKSKDILSKIKNEKNGKVANVKKTEFKQQPPTPFDLTTLQTEAYRTLGIPPSQTLELAQSLYLDGSISYPRTSSQQLPESIKYKEILKKLQKQDSYVDGATVLLLKKELKPNNGKKTDPAHPAIYPTGTKPSMAGREIKLYDLIVRRFLATFGDIAIRETMKIDVDVKEEIFIAKGTRTKVKGWHELYGRYATQKEEELPDTKEGDSVVVEKFEKLDKETQPPKRYTQASIIKELEKKGLGTKSTRANIVDNLHSRGYVTDKAIRATTLGIKTVDTLLKYSPDILDEELTRDIEQDMQKIREGKEKEEEVLDNAKKVLTKTLEKFKVNEMQIGEKLLEASDETERALATVGPCPVCGGTLLIRRGKYGSFIACDRYPDCHMTYKLPSGALCKVTKKKCETCGQPKIDVIRRGKRPQELCINPECETKKLQDKVAQKEVDDIEAGKIHKKCPICGENMIVRKSIYGAFLGCSGYPKCKHCESLDHEKKGESSGSSEKNTAVKKPAKKFSKKKPTKKKVTKKKK